MFVADGRNHRVLQLSGRLALETEKLLDSARDGLVKEPRRLHYVDQADRLVVGNCNNIGVVQIFSIRG